MAKTTVSQLRADLKGAGAPGAISRMPKGELLKLAKTYLQDDSSNAPVGGAAPSIQPVGDVQTQPSNGDNSAVSVQAGAAPSIPAQTDGSISLAPAKTSSAQPEYTGGGTKHQNTGFRAFVKANAKKYKGNMKEMSAAWKKQSGNGVLEDKIEAAKQNRDAAVQARQNAAVDRITAERSMLTTRAGSPAFDDDDIAPEFDEDYTKYQQVLNANVNEDAARGRYRQADRIVRYLQAGLEGQGKNAHDKFMHATHDYCEQQGEGMAEAQMNGAGRNDDDAEGGAYEQTRNALWLGDDAEANKLEGSGKRSAADIEADEDALHAAEEMVQMNEDHVDRMDDRVQRKDRRVKRAKRRHANAQRRATLDAFHEYHPDYTYTDASDQPDEPGTDLRDPVAEADREDALAYQAMQSADAVHLYTQEFEGAQRAMDRARADLKAAQQMLDQQRARVQRAQALDDAEDQNPDREHQLNGEERHVLSYLEATDSDDEDLLAPPFAGSGYEQYLEGGSFWKSALDAAGTVLEGAAVPIASLPIPGARVVAGAAGGLGLAAQAGSKFIKD